MQFTVTPVRPRSIAIERVRPTTPCFATVYGPVCRVAPRPSVDAMLMMRPSPFRTSCGRHARTRRWWAVSSTSIARCQLGSYSSSDCSSDPPTAIPALFTRMSTSPSVDWTAPTTRWIASRSVTSSSKPSAVPPASRISFTTASTRAAPRSVTATRAPSSAKRWAVARPMPLAAPVIRTTRSATERESFVSRDMGGA